MKVNQEPESLYFAHIPCELISYRTSGSKETLRPVVVILLPISTTFIDC